MHYSVDINCDMGEGMANDVFIMPYISSANIACGYHAGDAASMHRTLEWTREFHVAAGAHPSYPDRINFGRTNMQFPVSKIKAMVKEQVELLANAAAKLNIRLQHVKPHGAMYNMASKDEVLSAAICKAVLEIDEDLLIYAQSGSKLLTVAQFMGLTTRSEVFADRTYCADGSLTPRTQPNALLHDENEVISQVLQMISRQNVTCTDGNTIPVNAETICIHGDGEHAVVFAKAIHDLLQANGIPQNQ